MNLEIINTKVFGLKDALYRAGYPMKQGSPENLYQGKDLDVIYPTMETIPSVDYYRECIDTPKTVSNLGSAKTGSGHDSYLKSIIVTFDLKQSLKMGKQLSRYSFLEISSSQSTMHRITKADIKSQCPECVPNDWIEHINGLVLMYNAEPDKIKKADLFEDITDCLPSGYYMWMGIVTNYLQLKTIYHQRKNHKLKDWKLFCNWCEKLPLFKELILSKPETTATDIYESKVDSIREEFPDITFEQMDYMKSLITESFNKGCKIL